MSNPNPIQTEELKAKQYKAYGDVDVPLAKKSLSLRLPADVQEALDNLEPEVRIPFLRNLISDAVREKFVEDSW
ncbi:MAG: hypothetical protein ACRC2V_02795, partial [Xenococcaceae cyanobacterium]